MVKVEEVEVAGGFENDEIAACAEVLFNFVDGREIPYNPNPNINSSLNLTLGSIYLKTYKVF